MTENFVPMERATGFSPEGYAASDYDIIANGVRLGEVSVWTQGAKSFDQPGDDSTALLVAFNVENMSDQPIEIEPDDVSIFVGDKRIQPSAAEVIAGDPTIEPRDEATVVFRFRTSDGIDPQELDAFEIAWRARSGELVYEQRTPFTEFEVPSYAYYDPYIFDYYYYRPFRHPFIYY